jgi:hypothetical protein
VLLREYDGDMPIGSLGAGESEHPSATSAESATIVRIASLR